jgi:hypothetical protein
MEIDWSIVVERDQNKPTGEELIRLTARSKAAG